MNQIIEHKQAKRISVLEAALYSAGRPIEIESLQNVLMTRSNKVVKKLMRSLEKRYEARGSALEIKELPGNRVVLRLRKNFSDMVRKFTNRPLLTMGPLKTLSYIAYYQPVEQSKVIMDRGSHAYAHLRMMEEMGLIFRERQSGREVLINTTPYFSDYFSFSHDPLKSKLQLRMMFNKMKITKLDNGDEEIDRSVVPDTMMPIAPIGAEALSESVDKFHHEFLEYTEGSNRELNLLSKD